MAIKMNERVMNLMNLMNEWTIIADRMCEIKTRIGDEAASIHSDLNKGNITLTADDEEILVCMSERIRGYKFTGDDLNTRISDIKRWTTDKVDYLINAIDKRIKDEIKNEINELLGTSDEEKEDEYI